MQEALLYYRLAFDKQARATGASVRWIGQHGLIWSLIRDYEFDAGKWMGLCAGLALDWLKAKAAGGNLLDTLREQQSVVFTAPSDKTRAKIAKFAADLLESHNDQRYVRTALSPALAHCGSKDFPYPFTKMEGAFAKDRYYYISSDIHAMAAYSSALGVVTFYDPNVGEVAGTSPRFCAPYLKDCIDASFSLTERPASEKAAKVMNVQLFLKSTP